MKTALLDTLSAQVDLVSLVHHMGGTIRKDFSSKVTHLIAHSTHGEKYRVSGCHGRRDDEASLVLEKVLRGHSGLAV